MGRILKKCSKLLKKIDIFGVPTKIKFFDEEEFQTIYGAFLTIILVGLLAYKTITLIFDTITLKTFTYMVDTNPEFNEPLELNNFTLYVCPTNHLNIDLFTFSKIVNLNNKNAFSNYPEQCSLNWLESILNITNNCYCYNLSNHILTDSTAFQNLSLSTTTIKVNQNTTKSQDTEIDENDSDYNLCLFYRQDYVTTNDYIHPLQSREKMNCFSAVNKREISIDFYFEKISIRRENDFTLKFMGEKEVNFDTFRINDISITNSFSNNLSNNSNLGLKIQFYHSGWLKIYTFNGFDGDQFFSTLGGFYEILTWLFSLIGNFVNDKVRVCYIRKKLTNKQEDETLEGFEIYKQRTTHFKIELENMKKEQTPVNIVETSLNSRKSEIENNSKSIPKSSNKEEEVIQESNISINKNSNINNNSKENFKIIPKIADNLKKQHQKTLLTIKKKENEEKKKKFNRVEQFETYMDLNNLYKLVKEVKLLEVLCLSSTKGFLFFNALKNEIDLELLEEKMQEFASSDIDSETGKKNNFDKKVTIIKECLVFNQPKLKTVNSLIKST